MKPISEFWIYGDSLSTGTHGENAYLDTLVKELQIRKLVNYSVGSSGLSEKTPDSMMSILKKQLETEFAGQDGKPDVILIWHGSNDWYWGTPPDEFARDIRFAVRSLRKHFPETLILWPTPVFRLEKPYGSEITGDAFVNPNRNGNVMGDFIDILEKCGREEHFPVIEMGQSVNIHMANERFYLEDHVHPNERGYRRIARVLTEEIQRYWNIAGNTGS